MKSVDLLKTLDRLGKSFYTIADLEKITGLKRTGLYVKLKRLVDSGLLEPIGPGVYRLFSKSPAPEETAASLYRPNYLSFESGLSQHGVLNLVPYTMTFATTRKTARFTIEGREAEFRQIKPALFCGFDRQKHLYVAKPEKAFLDLAYFASRGLATIDFDEIDTGKLSMPAIRKLLKKYPAYTAKHLRKAGFSA